MTLLQTWIDREDARRAYCWRPKRPERNAGDQLAHVIVRQMLAFRNALTRALLQARGIAVPEVYGDPSLLLPWLFARTLLGVHVDRPYVVVPHFNEPAEKYAAHADRLVLPTLSPLNFVRALLTAGCVVSSSLCGVIIAEAYGVPAVYLDSGNGEHRFKYDDYDVGTGRTQWQAGTTVDECRAVGGNADFDRDSLRRGLVGAFPYDLWQ